MPSTSTDPTREVPIRCASVGHDPEVTWKRGSVGEWAVWTGAFGLGLTGFGDGLRVGDLGWSVPSAGVIAYVGLPWLTRFRQGAIRLGKTRRK
jgi:hypothetical protein